MWRIAQTQTVLFEFFPRLSAIRYKPYALSF
jgi:hypothetical protein